jgi:NAD(P)-dependent dehydrogenase (short-subunit alcohol dehydrogenase family)
VRNIWGFTGLQPTPKFNLKDIESYPSKPPRGLIAARDCLAVYGNAKMFMTMFMKTLAEENNDIYFATVSPGGVATTFYVGMPQPLRFVGALVDV